MREHREKTLFITETLPAYHDTDMHSEVTICLNGQRVSLSAASETTVHHKRPSLSCNSDRTVNVRKFSMSCNSDITVSLNSLRPSLTCNSDQTVNVRKFSMTRNSNLTICLGSQRASLSCNSDGTINVRQPSMSCNSDNTVCLVSQRPSLSCNSDCTVNVRQPSMSRNSNLTICLGSQRASLSCNSDCTVNVWQPRLRSSSDCTVNVRKFSMSCNSDVTVCIPQEWDKLRKSSDVIVCYDERLSLRTCASIELSENKDLSDEQVGVIDKILLNLSPDGHEENRQRMSHYCYGSGTLTHRRKTYSPSSDGHRSRFASSRSMNPTLAKEMAMRLAGSERAKGWTVASLFTPRNLFKLSPLIILFAMLLPYLHVDLHQCPLEDESFHWTFQFGEDAHENEIEVLKRDWIC